MGISVPAPGGRHQATPPGGDAGIGRPSAGEEASHGVPGKPCRPAAFSFSETRAAVMRFPSLHLQTWKNYFVNRFLSLAFFFC